MLANNNRAILRRLARNELRREWKRTAVLFMAIVVATVLLFGVFTTGLSYLSLSRLQDTRLYGGEQDILLSNGYTPAQLETLQNDARVESVGQQAYAGYIQRTEADDTVSVGLLWDDEVLWNTQRAEVITAQEGYYPVAANEVMASRDALAACGLAELGVGDRFSATVETNRGVMTEEFVIAGIWEGYGDTSPIYVSRAFFDRSGYALAESGILSVKLAHDYVLPGTINDLRDALDLNEMQVFQSSSYIDTSWKILLGVVGLALVIALSAYLLVYNILYLSAAGKSRYYGLLQTLGMTERQVAQLVRRQMLGIAFAAMAVGTMLGAGTSLVVVPQLMRALPGVADVHEVVGVPFTLADDDFAAAWLESYCESRPYLTTDDVMADFRNDPTRYFGMLRAVDAEEFEHLNSQLAEPIDREKFLAGEVCLLASSSIALPETSSLTLESGGQSFSLEIAAEVYDSGDLGASRNIGPDLIVSRDWLDSLGVAPFVTNLSVHYAEPGDAQTEAQVQALLADEPNLGEIFVQSHLAEVQAVQSTEGDLNETGAAIALLLLFVGMLNYVGTMAASVQSRRLSFSIMESLGMTPRAAHRQLLCEGLLIALGVLALTATLGLAVTFVAFQAMNHTGVPFTLPIGPILGAAALVILLCAVVPLVCYNRLADEGALVARLRMSE